MGMLQLFCPFCSFQNPDDTMSGNFEQEGHQKHEICALLSLKNRHDRVRKAIRGSHAFAHQLDNLISAVSIWS